MEWLDINDPLLEDRDWTEIGDNIRKKRQKRKWTQEELAGRICSDRNIVSRHENADVKITFENLLKYAAVFNCPLNDLLPARFRAGAEQLKGLTPELYATMCVLATMTSEKQIAMNRAIRNIIEFAA